MRNFLPMLFITSLSCSHVSYVTKEGSNQTISFEEFNRMFPEETAVIHLESGTVPEARDVFFGKENLRWIDAHTGETGFAAIGNVKSIDIRSNSKGALEGTVFGSIGVAGLLFLTSTRNENGDLLLTSDQLPKVGLILQMTVLTSTLIGHLEKYTLRTNGTANPTR